MTTIERLEMQIEELKAEVARLKDKEALKRTEHYYFLNIDGDGDFYIDEDNDGITTDYYDNWNYFLSEESSERFLSAVEELKVLQHYYEMYCPNYIPNWNDEDEEKWYIIFSARTKKYCYDYSFIEYRTTIYFDSEETVRKVCDRLNENL